MRKLFSKRKTILISIFSFLLLIVGAISIIALLNNNSNGDNPKFRYNSGYYNDARNGITSSTLDSEYQKMNTLYTATGSSITRSSVAIDTNKTIAIETALDFYAFVELANTNNAFLAVSVLSFNILRLIGDKCLQFEQFTQSSRKKTTLRMRIKSVINKFATISFQIIRHARNFRIRIANDHKYAYMFAHVCSLL